MRSADEHVARLRDNAVGEISSDETLLVGLALDKADAVLRVAPCGDERIAW